MCFVALLASFLTSSTAFAGVWFELLRAPCFTGDKDNMAFGGRYRGAVDCFNEDFNGGGARTTLTIKAFQQWEYGSVFLYYDITGPFTPASVFKQSANQKGGFFGGITVAVSPKSIAEKVLERKFDWGPLRDVSLKYEMEHVSKFGMLHYYGLQWDLAVPGMDFVTATTVIRDDWAFRGVDLQVGLAWQKSFSLGTQDFLFLGFFQTGLFGEGEGVGTMTGSRGNRFFLAQPELLWDFGKLVRFTPGKIYLGAEYQLGYNRYLIQGKIENVLQGMIRWNI
ncbi:hypothetical protein D187_002912 [Cystobacter fuscus DSM 2262]|uniref:Nucleoside-binding outer membrane protein n=1 Tax=Cystobacter fuscus (strain ATCC 25194 / DSM 2262 / NBRC 100088 / M29) TaxID=1242864 RepID=S9PAX2_CYSF2|nr:hypothetical protein D187_002912 [Cystobacter fuscus DSM 2262]